MKSQESALKTLAGKLIVGLEGTHPTAKELDWLLTWQPAGVILFSRNVESFTQLKNLCVFLKAQVPGLLLMTDHEGGPVSQMAAAVGRPPVAFSLGMVDDVLLTRQVHEETGKRLRAAGLDWVLGPCADVLTAPRNPVIGARAFGRDAELVARHVVAAVSGLRAAGISCCLKHWPGHGGSETDSHLEITRVPATELETIPFTAGVNAGAHALMPGHLCLADGDLPATLSRDFLESTHTFFTAHTKKLILVADDISMGALRLPMARLGVEVPGALPGQMLKVSALPREWFLRLAEAGCDRLLIRGIPLGAFPCEKTCQPKAVTDIGFPEHRFDDRFYREARKRSFLGIVSPGENLFYLDLARSDRWQVASGMGPAQWTRWDKLLGDRFSKVFRVDSLDQPISGEGPVTRLLVTHHRPLPPQWASSPWARSLAKRMGSTGTCLLMGHPSLQEDFQCLLSPGWETTALFDVSYEDLSALW